MGTKIHKGLWLECKVCPHTEEELKAKREKRERPSFRRKRLSAATADIAVRRQVAYELGGPDAEPTSEQKFQMLQKYGIAAPRIDRAVTKPKWMSDGLWRTKRAEFYQATKNLVPKEQFKRREVHAANNQSRRSSVRAFDRNRPHRTSK
jgi:hypothetical protein